MKVDLQAARTKARERARVERKLKVAKKRAAKQVAAGRESDKSRPALRLNFRARHRLELGGKSGRTKAHEPCASKLAGERASELAG